jgi:hypothetical protein
VPAAPRHTIAAENYENQQEETDWFANWVSNSKRINIFLISPLIVLKMWQILRFVYLGSGAIRVLVRLHCSTAWVGRM